MKVSDRIVALLSREGPPMSGLEINQIVTPFCGLGVIQYHLWRLEDAGTLRSDWRPLRPGRKYRTKEYWIAK